MRRRGRTANTNPWRRGDSHCLREEVSNSRLQTQEGESEKKKKRKRLQDDEDLKMTIISR